MLLLGFEIKAKKRLRATRHTVAAFLTSSIWQQKHSTASDSLKILASFTNVEMRPVLVKVLSSVHTNLTSSYHLAYWTCNKNIFKKKILQDSWDSAQKLIR